MGFKDQITLFGIVNDFNFQFPLWDSEYEIDVSTMFTMPFQFPLWDSTMYSG